MTKLKRTTHKPEGFTEEQMQGFSLLSHKASAIAITNRLTGSQFRLWHYLMMIDPFADQTSSGERIYHELPSPVDIGRAIGANPKTVEIDMRRLEQLGLYAKRITEWQGYNLTAEDAHKASAAMKQAKAERAVLLPVKQRQQPPVNLTREPVQDQKSPEPLQDKGCYLTEAETLTGLGQGLKPLQDKRCYLTPDGSYLTPDKSYLTPEENAGTPKQQEVQAFETPEQIIQSNLDLTNNGLAEKKLFGEEEEKEANQGVDDSGTLQETQEPTGILEEPLDPITQVQEATVQLLDEREIFDDLRRLGIERKRWCSRHHEEIQSQRTEREPLATKPPWGIAHIKQRYDNHERFKNITGAFVKACQESTKPRPTTRSQVNPPTIEQMCQLELALVAGTIRDFYLAPCSSDREMIMVDTGSCLVPWWEYRA